jgi:hypothetical protein
MNRERAKEKRDEILVLNARLWEIICQNSEEARGYEQNLDKILWEIAAFDGYFARLGNEMAQLEKLYGEAQIKALEIKTQIAVLKSYDKAACSRVAALKSLKQSFK